MNGNFKSLANLRITALALALSSLVILGIARSGRADPCGMVPPVYLQGKVPLQRVGLQKTYVFYKDGIETFVIRPGFEGKVEEFGMLIPFPTPPALRKVPDDTFAHIAAAIDPPEVIVDLQPIHYYRFSDAAMPSSGAMGDEESSLALRQVAVLNQEAVGMYEVAVLQAGSSAALNSWMTDHGYRYPEGMDSVCEDYIADQWCFVAVKARVGAKSNVDPRPGMEKTDDALPKGASFQGHVQGMGFRFKSPELVVPMRLSAFNEGELHNVVYLLSDRPMKAEQMSEGLVVRQVEGARLLKNLLEPLPLRIIGGEYKDIPEHRKTQLVSERDPAPHNGIAKQLFAGDLFTADTGLLIHEHEEQEKRLLDIGERLLLRGPEIDTLHHTMLAASKKKMEDEALDLLSDMTMTVIDGNFEREVIAQDNVHFTEFSMDKTKNNAKVYNSRTFGPSSEGVWPELGMLDDAAPTEVTVAHPAHGTLILQQTDRGIGKTALWIGGLVGVATAVFLSIILIRTRQGVAVLLVGLTVGGVFSKVATAQQIEQTQQIEVGRIPRAENRQEQIDKIVSQGDEAVEALMRAARESAVEVRGWSIVCLQEIGTPRAQDGLRELWENSAGQPQIVRVWAAASLINLCNSFDEVKQYASQANSFSALRRPLRMKIEHLLASDGKVEVVDLLQLCTQDSLLAETMAPTLLGVAPERLVYALLHSEDTLIRQQAASWLATQKTQDVQGVNRAVIKGLRFARNAETAPWGDGPLFIPGVNWQKEEAVELISELTAWLVWCTARDDEAQRTVIYNNLNSWQLMQAAGFQSVPQDLASWLNTWRGIIGQEAMDSLMKRTGYEFTPAILTPRR